MTDLRGDVLELLDADGARFVSYRYSVWGEQELSASATAKVSAALASRIASRQALRYAGYAYDAAHKLYYCQARYYDPVTRAFLSRDPAKADGIASAYQYCAGNPTLASDPTGERPVAGSNDASDADEKIVTIRDPETGQWIGMSYEVASLLSGPWSGANAAPAPGSPGAPVVNVQVTHDALAGAFAVPLGDLSAGEAYAGARAYLEWMAYGGNDEEMRARMGAGYWPMFVVGFVSPTPAGKGGAIAKGGTRADDVARLVDKAGQLAFRSVKGSGPVVGTARHVHAEELLKRYQRMYGDVGLTFRDTYRDAAGVVRARLDVRHAATGRIWDWKFGPTARMSKAQFAKYSRFWPGETVTVLKYP